MTERQRLIIESLLTYEHPMLPYKLTHTLTQPGDPKKAKRTWQHCVNVYLAERRNAQEQ